MMMGSLEPGQLTGKYFSSRLTGYEPHMEVSCLYKEKETRGTPAVIQHTGAV